MNIANTTILYNLNENLALVARDAGGANILASLCRKHSLSPKIAVQGPAADIFHLLSLKTNSIDLSNIDKNTKLIISGTSEINSLEIEALEIAKQMNIYSISFLDHWSNYRSRFENNGKLLLPDEIWVGDKHAYAKAIKDFPKELVRYCKNPYFEEILSEIRYIELNSNLKNNQTLHPNDEPLILYLTEPAGKFAKNFDLVDGIIPYDEFTALDYFLIRMKKRYPNIRKLRIRLHPSESFEKYRKFFSGHTNFNFSLSRQSLAADICASDIIVGTNSMGLVISSLAGKISISAIPPNGFPCVLPFSGVQKIDDFWI